MSWWRCACHRGGTCALMQQGLLSGRCSQGRWQTTSLLVPYLSTYQFLSAAPCPKCVDVCLQLRLVATGHQAAAGCGVSPPLLHLRPA